MMNLNRLQKHDLLPEWKILVKSWSKLKNKTITNIKNFPTAFSL